MVSRSDSFLWASLLAAVLFPAVFLSPAQARAIPKELLCPGCNVILVTIDVLRGDELQVGGGTRAVMPHLDALTAKGVSFVNAFSQSPDTLASSLSITSGLYPWHHGVNLPLRDDSRREEWRGSTRTLAGILARRGYEIRSSVLGPEGDVNGWLGKEAPLDRPGRLEGLGGAKRFFLVLRGGIHDPYFPRYGDVAYLDPAISETDYPSEKDVLGCQIASLLAGRTPSDIISGEFMNLGSSSTRTRVFDHALHIVGMTDPKGRLDAVRNFDPAAEFYVAGSLCFWSFFSTETAKTRGRLLYDALARDADRRVWEVFMKLESMGLLEKSLIVITSQHGEEFLEHGLLTHSQQLYDESLHVPLILLFPGLKGGRVVSGVAQSVDIVPTILQSLGLGTPSGLDGASLLPCIMDSEECADRRTLAHWNGAFSLRDGRFTYLRLPKGDSGSGEFIERLFDRRSDPKENNDVSALEPGTTARLRSLLLKNIGEERGYQGRWPPWADEKLKRQIRRTGYW